jgi:hypothetical protein
MYDKQIEYLKTVIKRKLVIENPESMKHLHSDFVKILDRFYENTYEAAYAQGWDEGVEWAKQDFDEEG